MYGVDNTSSPQLTVLTATFEIRNGKERGLRGMHNFFFFLFFLCSKRGEGKNKCWCGFFWRSRMERRRSEGETRKGPWTAEEDEILINFVNMNGPRDWSSIRSKGLLPRTGKSCRLRWVNKLRPNLKKVQILSRRREGGTRLAGYSWEQVGNNSFIFAWKNR